MEDWSSEHMQCCFETQGPRLSGRAEKRGILPFWHWSTVALCSYGAVLCSSGTLPPTQITGKQCRHRHLTAEALRIFPQVTLVSRLSCGNLRSLCEEKVGQELEQVWARSWQDVVSLLMFVLTVWWNLGHSGRTYWIKQEIHSIDAFFEI